MAQPREPQPLRIAVAEDDPDDRLLLAEALAVAGIEGELRFMEDGAQLLDYLRAVGHVVDLVVLDLNMPRKDGGATLRAIKADPQLRSLPVIMLTTSSAERDADGAQRAGARAFVVKPASFASLVEAVRLFPKYAVRAS